MAEMELGSLLKKAREEKGLSLDDIQEETKIRKKYLQAIEENNFDVLPGNVYLKVFVKGYAREVDINYKALLKEYPVLSIKEENESNLQKDYLNSSKVTNKSQKKDKKNPLKIIFIILLILFLGAAAVYTYQYVNNSELRLLNQSENQEENLDTEAEILEIERDNESQNSETDDIEQENSVDAELNIFEDTVNSEFEDELLDSFDSSLLTEENTEIIEQNNFNGLEGPDLQEQNQINEIIISDDINAQESETTAENESEADASNLESDDSTADAISEEDSPEAATEAVDTEDEEREEAFQDNNITLQANDTVWITIDLDGTNVFSGILEAGDQQDFEIEERLYIKIGNGSAITAEWAGESYGPWAGSGEIAEVEFLNQEQDIEINNLRD